MKIPKLAAGATDPYEWVDDGRPFVPEDVFRRAAPVELEIGFGKGRFLVESATARPAVDFVGIEYASKYFRLVLARATKRKLGNVRVVRADARLFVEERLADRSVDRIHVYFPDPWPKRRQQKRRLLDPPFVHVLVRKLRPGGEVRLATDHADYYREIYGSFDTEPRFVAGPPPAADGEGLTNYERKYRKEGRPIYRALWTLG